MEKIDITAGTTAGDSGPVAGVKLNNNFKEVVRAAFGAVIWDGNVDQAVSLADLPTNNKSSLFAAIVELYAKAATIDDSLSESIFKTWSINKLVATFIDQDHLIEVKIQGLIVQTAGKTDLTILQDNDLFRYHTASRYCVGVILDASSITIPQDLDDSNKIKLQYDA
jgi:hypothetical protein